MPIKYSFLKPSLEQIRSNHKWDFSISVNENINSNLIKIPPLILQPFVENAIIHGLKNKLNGKGQIDISIHKNQNNILEITIDDNGIGRINSSKNQNKNTYKKEVTTRG